MTSDARDDPSQPPTQASPLGLSGQIVGGYRLTRPLAHWPVGAVYLGDRVAHDTSSPTAAVIKVLGMSWTDRPGEREDAAARFLQEVAIVQRLTHPHILRLLDAGRVRGMPYKVFPYMAGGTLATALYSGPLALPETARSLGEIAAALDYAHGQGILHGDVKPSHVLLDAEGASYLSEFGLARLLGAARDSSASTGIVIGTPEYMAPEQAQGVMVDRAADIFSLSVLLYQMVTGALPFSSQSPVETLLRVLRDAPISPRALRPALPAPAEAALLRGLAKRPEDRFASAGDLAQAFACALGGLRDLLQQQTRALQGAEAPRREGHRLISSALVRWTYVIRREPSRARRRAFQVAGRFACRQCWLAIGTVR